LAPGVLVSLPLEVYRAVRKAVGYSLFLFSLGRAVMPGAIASTIAVYFFFSLLFLLSNARHVEDAEHPKMAFLVIFCVVPSVF